MTFHWRDLGNKPVEVQIEDIYILTSSTSGKSSTSAEDEEKAYALKMERLKNAEMLKVRPTQDDSKGMLMNSDGALTYNFCFYFWRRTI